MVEQSIQVEVVRQIRKSISAALNVLSKGLPLSDDLALKLRDDVVKLQYNVLSPHFEAQESDPDEQAEEEFLATLEEIVPEYELADETFTPEVDPDSVGVLQALLARAVQLENAGIEFSISSDGCYPAQTCLTYPVTLAMAFKLGWDNDKIYELLQDHFWFEEGSQEDRVRLKLSQMRDAMEDVS